MKDFSLTEEREEEGEKKGEGGGERNTLPYISLQDHQNGHSIAKACFSREMDVNVF